MVLVVVMALTTASPISRVETFEVPSLQMSAVRKPSASTDCTACSMRAAASGWWRENLSIMAADRIVASGLAMPLPAISGALPWDGSYKPLLLASSEADGSMPIEPVSIAASSDRMSPNILPVTTTSNFLGALTSCMAALSTYMWSSSTSGYWACTSVTTSFQSWEVSSTLALSTLVSRLDRKRAAWKATCAMRSISGRA
mmetsp:Transcript_6771/g.28513  ORF Transcript_6771/g.28513 Transcript_6771/m.28513 type:complete len:200 (+) Transcript_6771:1962-2561(+)